MRRIVTCTGCFLLLCGVSVPATGETISIIPEFDWSASDSSGPGTVRDGIFDAFFNEEDDSLIRAFNGNSSEIRGALEIPLTSVPRVAVIETATLFLKTSGRGQGPSVTGSVSLHGYAGNGVADLADFSADNLLTTWPAEFPLELPPLSTDVTDFVHSLRDAHVSHAGFTLRATPGIFYGVASTEFGYEPYTPRLEITYSPIPEPGSGMLILLCAVMAATRRVRWRTRRCVTQFSSRATILGPKTDVSPRGG